MNKLFAATALVIAVLSAPAHAECVSDLIKVRNHLPHARLDPAMASRVHWLIVEAQTDKTEGNFENCNTRTRQLLQLLDIE